MSGPSHGSPNQTRVKRIPPLPTLRSPWILKSAALTNRQEEAIRLRFGLTPRREAHTLGEIGAALGISKEAAQHFITNGLRKIKNPNNAGLLVSFID